MSEMIAVWGSPYSGKTTFAVKLAKAIYDDYRCTVITVFADNETPVLPVLFPGRKKEDMYSAGVPLSKTDMTREEIIRNMITVKEMQNFGFLGYKDGENRYTYPAPDENKISSFFDVLSGLADYVVVDCTSGLSSLISRHAVKHADEVIRLSSPDLRSISWLSSQLPLFSDPVFRLDRQIQGLNVPDSDLYMPVEEAKAHIQDIRFTLPYSRSVRQQMMDGKLWQNTNDRDFNRIMHSIAEKVV